MSDANQLKMHSITNLFHLKSELCLSLCLSLPLVRWVLTDLLIFVLVYFGLQKLLCSVRSFRKCIHPNKRKKSVILINFGTREREREQRSLLRSSTAIACDDISTVFFIRVAIMLDNLTDRHYLLFMTKNNCLKTIPMFKFSESATAIKSTINTNSEDSIVSHISILSINFDKIKKKNKTSKNCQRNFKRIGWYEQLYLECSVWLILSMTLKCQRIFCDESARGGNRFLSPCKTCGNHSQCIHTDLFVYFNCLACFLDK